MREWIAVVTVLCFHAKQIKSTTTLFTVFGDFVDFDFDFVDFDFDFVDFEFVDFAFDAALAQALTNEIVFSGVFCFLRLL